MVWVWALAAGGPGVAEGPPGGGGLWEVDVQGPAAIAPGARVMVWVWALAAGGPGVVVCGAAEGVAAVDAAALAEFGGQPRRCPGVLVPPTVPLQARPVGGAVIDVGVGSLPLVLSYSVATGVGLVRRPGLGVIDLLVRLGVPHRRVALDVVGLNFILSYSVATG